MENEPGQLATLCEAMADSRVNLLLSATSHGGTSGVIAFIADDEALAQEVLDKEGIEYLLRPALTIRMQNSPGTGAAAFRKLADAGVNVDLVLPVRISEELFYAVLCVDDMQAASAALGDLVTS